MVMDKDNDKKTKVQLFTAELEALCEKYNASIWGCGCCGSPILSIVEEDGTTTEYKDFSCS